MTTYKHSGTTGDLIYSLEIVKKQGGGSFNVAIGNIENCIMQYTGRPADVSPEHQGRFTERDFDLLAPLLERQSYITTVGKWYPGDPEPKVDLDHFRSYLYRQFEGNIIKAYHGAFNMPWHVKCTMICLDDITFKLSVQITTKMIQINFGFGISRIPFTHRCYITLSF